MLIHKFENKTETYSVLDMNGNLKSGYSVPLSRDDIRRGYYFMKLSRQLDEKMLKMQRQGRMLTFPPNMGEEALQVATAFGMNKEDWLVPAFRSGTAFLALGIPAWQMMLLWNGNEMGNKIPEGLNIVPANVPIGTQYSHATGVGFALAYNNKPNVAFTFIGDGGTSEGEFYESMNFGGVRGAHTVYCVNNNQWAISTPTNKETAQIDICTKAIAAGLAYIKVDGNDLFASYDAVVAAKDYVIKNHKPILIEFVTYRQGPHTTADNPRVYRSAEYEEEQNKKCPILRLEKWMLANGVMTQSEINAITAKIESELDEASNIMESKKKVTIDEIFDYTYAKNYDELKEQKAEAKRIFGDK